MSVVQPVTGSSATFVYNVCTHLFVYIKRKKERVKKLAKNFAQLEVEVDDLKAHWNNTNPVIQRCSVEKSNRYTALKNRVDMLCVEFEKIKRKYTKYCKNVETQNQTTAPRVPSNDGQQEASNGANVDQPSTNARAQESAGPPKQKIWTWKFFKLAQLDKDIVDLIPKIRQVIETIRTEDLISEVKPNVVVRMEAKELNNISSHEEHLENLKKYLSRENCKRIGIYGAPGVGITNIMKNLNNCFHPSTLSDCNLNLDYVIWVAVPGNLNNKKMILYIQEKIMERLHIDVQKYKSWNHAEIISTELSAKNYLLLLDDFSSLIKLEEIGIREEHKDGKVVIAGKDAKALSDVKLDRSFKVECLSFEDSRQLFNKFVEIDALSEEQRGMVGPILKQLGGLPGVIKPTAEYLNKHRDQGLWAGVKRRLQSNICQSRLLGLGGLKMAYELFYDELTVLYKKCLLYAALFPSGHMIHKSTLVECWKAEQCLEYQLSITMQAARNEGEVVFTELENRYLLESCCKEYVKMPEFFRKVALVLPFPEDADGALIVRFGPEIDGHLREEEWNVARWVSLMGNKLKGLPLTPQCDRISTLLLQLNPELIIPDSFLGRMKTLIVLDLQKTGITFLPSSIAKLTALRCLYLNDCGGLKKLPHKIVKLTELEVLDIQGTSIPYLPEEISCLINLRCLRISVAAEACNPNPEPKKWLTAFVKTRTWVIFPPGRANKLHKLEELTIALGETGITEEILNQIQTEVREFKSTKVFFTRPSIQRPFQSPDQENPIQNGKGTNRPNPSLLENPGQDLTTEIQSPRSENEGLSNLQSGSTRGRTDSNDQASKKDKGKGIAIPKLKNKAIPELKNKANSVGIKFKELPQTNACPPEIQEEYNIPNQQIERSLGDHVDQPNSSAGASTSRNAGRSN